MIRRHIMVTGLVQGVGFRYSTRAAAKGLGLAGYVRNAPDGSVEVEAQGPADAVTALVDWLRTGPRGAHVTGIDVTEVEPGEVAADGVGAAGGGAAGVGATGVGATGVGAAGGGAAADGEQPGFVIRR
jgi:acylphosphatase